MQREARVQKVTAKGAALAALAELKKGGVKRSDQFKLAVEDDVYDEMDETAYQDHVAKRREENFIEDDAGNGDYVDFGQEDWDDAEYSGDEAGGEAGSRRVGKKPADKGRGLFNNLAPKAKKKATERVSGMFLGAAGREILGGRSSGKAVGKDEAGDALLDSLLGEIEQDPLTLASSSALNKGLAGAATAKRTSMPQFRARVAAAQEAGVGAPSTYGRAPPPVGGFDLPSFSARPPPPPPAAGGWDAILSAGRDGDIERGPQYMDGDTEGGHMDAEADGWDAGGSGGFGDGVEGSPMEDAGPAGSPGAGAQGGKAGGVGAAGSVAVGAEDEEDSDRRAVPFMREVEVSTGVDWFQVVDDTSPSSSDAPPSSAPVAVGALPPLEPDGSLRFYWLDAYEDELHAPGSVYLFGKVGTAGGGWASCCIQLKGCERNAFVLPRATTDNGEGVTFVQVFEEVSEICKKAKISKFGCKKVERSYAFEEPGIPATSPYLKIVYSAEFPALQSDLTGKTFSRVFGTHASCLELLLIKRRISGPCWLNLTGVTPASSAASWAKFELALPQGKKGITLVKDPPPPPTLVVAALHVQTVLSNKHVQEVAIASLITHVGVQVDGATPNPTALSSCSVVRKLDKAWPWDLDRIVRDQKLNPHLNLEIVSNERALLSFLVGRIHNIDPDVIVGHNIAGHDIAVLLQRLQTFKIQHWSKLGRMRIRNMPRLSGGGASFGGGGNWAEWSVVCGRLMCDTFTSSRELLTSQRSYALKELARTQLGANKPEVEPSQIYAAYDETASLLQLVRYVENDAFLSLQLMFKLQVLPLTKQLTALAGNLWSNSLQGKRAERIEYLLLHEFHRLKYIVPDKESYAQRAAKRKVKALAGGATADDIDEEEASNGRRGDGQTGRKKPAYAGGLVLEPRRGFYEHLVVLLDFNSLYPSIVQEYNICFTTITRPTAEPDGTFPLAVPPPASVETGVLPKLIGNLVARRREVKNLLKAEANPARRAQLDIRQKALKIMANSMYGCLGFEGSRFYARALAELITARGRDALTHAVEIAGHNNLDVIYGDTDSIMVHSGTSELAEAVKMAENLKREINKHYRCMEIDLDGVMKSMLLLKKKKYAALLVEEVNGKQVLTRETKGLDLVRRDWCNLSREAGSTVLDFILSGRPKDELVSAILGYLGEIKDKVEKNELPLDAFVITKQLTKAPKDYTDAKNQPHVLVAKQMIEQGETVPSGAVIEYVICADDSKTGVAERAHHPKTVLKAEGYLQVDVPWYMAQQLLPPIFRLCEPIDGLTSEQIAAALGLDAAKFRSHSADLPSAQRDPFAAGPSDASRYADCDPLHVRCGACGQAGAVRGLVSDGSDGVSEPGDWRGAAGPLGCAGCGGRLEVSSVRDALTLEMRKQTKEYYTACLQCDEASCRETSRSLSTHVSRDEAGLPLFPACTVARCRGKMQKTRTDRALHTQLLYYASLFDEAAARAKAVTAGKRRGEEWREPPPLDAADAAALRSLLSTVRTTLEASAFDRVDLAALFAGM